MTNFKNLYKDTKKFPAETSYQGKTVVISDKFPLMEKDILTVNIESTKSDYLQGIRFGISGSCHVSGKVFKKGKFINLLLWEKANWYDLKNNQEISVYTKEPTIFVSNAWKEVLDGVDGPACWAGGDEWQKHDHWGGAGMIVEEIENGRRYYCNDGECDDDFDDLIFTVTRKSS